MNGAIQHDRARHAFARAKVYARAARALRDCEGDGAPREILDVPLKLAKLNLDKALMFRRMALVASGRLGVA